jgi:hypothetical protein
VWGVRNVGKGRKDSATGSRKAMVMMNRMMTLVESNMRAAERGRVTVFMKVWGCFGMVSAAGRSVMALVESNMGAVESGSVKG